MNTWTWQIPQLKCPTTAPLCTPPIATHRPTIFAQWPLRMAGVCPLIRSKFTCMRPFWSNCLPELMRGLTISSSGKKLCVRMESIPFWIQTKTITTNSSRVSRCKQCMIPMLLKLRKGCLKAFTSSWLRPRTSWLVAIWTAMTSMVSSPSTKSSRGNVGKPHEVWLI